MKKIILIFNIFFLALGASALAQQDSTVHITDDIQVDVKSVDLDSESDTLRVELFLISYQMDPREFKLNVFATQLEDKSGESHLFSSVSMGRVRVAIEDKQNYLHYLIEENDPVPFVLLVPGWGDREIGTLNVVFEDSNEEGHFITHKVDLSTFKLKH